MQTVCEMNLSYTLCRVPQDFRLTPRERQVMELVCAGYRNKEVAEKLGISEKAVQRNLTIVFDKWGVRNRIELVLLALDQGLIPED